MITTRQCELARFFMNSKKSSVEILNEYNSVSSLDRQLIAYDIESLLKKHNRHLDNGYAAAKEEFETISNNYKISPETLFCILIE